MIRGLFDPRSGRPLVDVRFGLLHQLVDTELRFLVDTGADITTISAHDAEAAGIDYDALPRSRLVGGLSGDTSVHLAEAVLILDDPERGACLFFAEVAILRGGTASHPLPSLLGRDVLDRVRLVYDRLEDELLLDPRAPDIIV